MLLNFFSSPLATPDALGRLKNKTVKTYLFDKETRTKIFRLFRHCVRHLDVGLQNHIHLVYQRDILSKLEGVEAR